MITRKYSKDKANCRVTFKLPLDISGEKVQLYGEFNNWKGEKMKKLKTGGFSLSITLQAGQKYQFRYLIDGERWENDSDADGFVPNPYGSEDSVLNI